MDVLYCILDVIFFDMLGARSMAEIAFVAKDVGRAKEHNTWQKSH